MTDRRRNNGPSEGTLPIFYPSEPTTTLPAPRHRQPNELRKFFLKTALTPPASGSSYLELPSPPSPTQHSTLKLAVTVTGPRPLPHSAPFSPQARLTTELKYAPFAAQKRRGYIRDGGERELATMITTALVRSIVLERYPKSSIEIMVTVLDCEDGPHSDVGVLSGAITAGSAALADAGVECVDLVCGGVAGLDGEGQVVLDPGPGECTAVVGVGYLAARDEVTVLWARGGMSVELEEDQMDMGRECEMEKVIGAACKAAREVRKVLNEAVAERLVVELEEKENVMKD